MPVFTPLFECRGGSVRWQLGAALFGCVMLAACAQAPASQSADAAVSKVTKVTPISEARAMTSTTATALATAALNISAITLERDCNGCPTGTRLELQRDGQAVATRTGKARLGTADSISRAPLPVAEFDTLAHLLLADGFFEMAAIYEAAGEQDGSWATLTVMRDGTAHQVFRREEAGPEALKSLEAAITALQARLRFVADAR